MSKYWWEEKNRWAKTDEQKMLRWAKEWWARFLRQMSTLSHRWATPTTVNLSDFIISVLHGVKNIPSREFVSKKSTCFSNLEKFTLLL